MFRLFNKRTISIVNTVFNLTCSCRPLTDTPYNLKTDMDGQKYNGNIIEKYW